MPSRKIEDFAMIGDCETAALVGRDGAVEWLCWPNFASDACFASLLGSADNGRWSLAPTGKHTEVTRRYRPHTLILETTISTSKGIVVLTDFMPRRGNHSNLIRIVHCATGKVEMKMELCPRFHYGSALPWIDSVPTGKNADAWVVKVGADLVVLRTAVQITESTPGTLSATFTLRAGERMTFALTYGLLLRRAPISHRHRRGTPANRAVLDNMDIEEHVPGRL